MDIHISEVIVRGHPHASRAQIEAEVRAGIARALAEGPVPRSLRVSTPLLRGEVASAAGAGDVGAAIVHAQPVERAP